MAIIKIVAINVNGGKATIYKADGNTIDLEVNDPNLARIVEEATPSIIANGSAEVEFENSKVDGYRDFEEKTNGVVKLFRVARSWIKSVFSDKAPEPVEDGVIGTIPDFKDVGTDDAHPVQVIPAKAAEMLNATAEILSRAVPASSDKFRTEEVGADDTIVAVVTNSDGKEVVIPGIENIQDHMKAAIKLGSTIGVENFLKRLSGVIEKRGHSVADLLNFMSRNDMPIADDGCIVAFKTLNRRGNKQDEYQDIHSGNVVQRVGSKVFMKESMVDPNRRNACSNGLHIARRAYVGGFTGSHGVMVLVKVAPEDAIAVPNYDANKMRACGYHIVADVPKEDHQTVIANKPFASDSSLGKLLASVLRGQHIGITELVEIGGSNGGNLKITKLGTEHAESAARQEAAEKQAKSKEGIASLDHEKDSAAAGPKVNITEAAAKATAAKNAVSTGGYPAKARLLFDAKKYQELRDLKKKAKKSYSALGFTEAEVTTILSDLVPEPEVKLGGGLITAVEEPTTTHDTVEEAMAELNKPEPEKETKKMTVAEEARKLFDEAVAGDRSRWGSLWTHKKKAKKGWDKLGFSKKEIERINTNKPDFI